MSPFDSLRMDPKLACLFFGMFARFEFALKEQADFCKGDQRGRAQADWDAFIAAVGRKLTKNADPRLQKAMRLLVDHPPMVQMYKNGHAQFQHRPFGPQLKTDGAKAIESARRVRNNLFHGGKHTLHSPVGWDDALAEAALIVLDACLQARPDVSAAFHAKPY